MRQKGTKRPLQKPSTKKKPVAKKRKTDDPTEELNQQRLLAYARHLAARRNR